MIFDADNNFYNVMVYFSTFVYVITYWQSIKRRCLDGHKLYYTYHCRLKAIKSVVRIIGSRIILSCNKPTIVYSCEVSTRVRQLCLFL